MQKVLVTGANRGIGLELCRQLKAQGKDVTAVCRNSSEELDGLGVHVIDQTDVADKASVENLAQQLKGQNFDVLINNAGVLSRNALGEIDYDTVMQQYQVNAMAPLMVTEALLENLHDGSKVAIVTSRMGSMTDNDSGGHYGYRMSKAAVNMAGTSLAVDLQPKGIAVGLLHPGYVKTDMTGGQGFVDTQHSAQGLLARIEQLNLENSGTFWHAEGEQLPW
ncbi:SDR family oxidoreductase [Marinicella sp. S1101]|uniref:SDR family oxidoreductase n=1 Tax=Marinicella marina TaxID=2996016 RepID=UPI002260D728|nr:SDR family oxidoreductase [Marinicella marina]MCX7553091.1 SDR family oxidoreductase [Marinicella marina]MDJ1138823.1 SDR family oxidoreductase [Marinicella marina]